MSVSIYQRQKSATQSGHARAGVWVLEYAVPDGVRHDPLTGWLGSGDTRAQVQLSFPTAEAAIAYAEKHGLDYTLSRGSERRRTLRAYADNFR